MAYLEQNIITDSQYGFRQKCSADLQLLQTIHDLASLLLCLNEKNQTNCIQLDFSKAFDEVFHHHLLIKLQYYGIDDQFNKWIASFLTGHNYTVGCL